MFTIWRRPSLDCLAMFERIPELRTAYCSECGCDREARLMHEVAENGFPTRILYVTRVTGSLSLVQTPGKVTAMGETFYINSQGLLLCVLLLAKRSFR